MNVTDSKQLGPWLALFHMSFPLKVSLGLIQYFGSPSALLSASDTELESLGVSEKIRMAIRRYQEHPQSGKLYDLINASLLWAHEPNRHLITLDDHHYPPRLKEITDPPLLLFVEGTPALLATPQMAVVGSRHASPSGIETANLFARQLAERGLTITSGLALGVDSASHQGALMAGRPTIAVMATGADQVYPRRHCDLAQEIRQQGALITEFPLGTAPKPAYFPQRNRVISGLSLGVLVVEAALRSGSLITARYAVEQGREVFAMPGSIHNPTTKGCHEMIRQGAKLVETLDDILEELNPQLLADVQSSGQNSEVKASEDEGRSGIYRQVLDLVGHETTPMDLLVERSGLPVVKLSQILMQLELDNRVVNVAGGFIRKISRR